MNAIPLGFCQCGCGRPTSIAPKTRAARGWVKGYPVRFAYGHNSKTGVHTVPQRAPRVDAEPFRQAFFRSGLSIFELAARLGWYWDGHPDTTRLQRRLGLVPYWQDGERVVARRLDHRTAVALAAALHLDPVDLGI